MHAARTVNLGPRSPSPARQTYLATAEVVGLHLGSGLQGARRVKHVKGGLIRTVLLDDNNVTYKTGIIFGLFVFGLEMSISYL